jgi:hypothetical protein
LDSTLSLKLDHLVLAKPEDHERLPALPRHVGDSKHALGFERT